jgi:hypothetical protein
MDAPPNGASRHPSALHLIDALETIGDGLLDHGHNRRQDRGGVEARPGDCLSTAQESGQRGSPRESWFWGSRCRSQIFCDEEGQTGVGGDATYSCFSWKERTCHDPSFRGPIARRGMGLGVRASWKRDIRRLPREDFSDSTAATRSDAQGGKDDAGDEHVVGRLAASAKEETGRRRITAAPVRAPYRLACSFGTTVLPKSVSRYCPGSPKNWT